MPELKQPEIGCYKSKCPVAKCVDLISGKYKTMILWSLLEYGTLRFSQLQRIVPESTARMLSRQLRELESDGLIHREVYKEIPPKVEYTITETGHAVKPLLLAMYRFGESYFAAKGEKANCSMSVKSFLEGDGSCSENSADSSSCSREKSAFGKDTVSLCCCKKRKDSAEAAGEASFCKDEEIFEEKCCCSNDDSY